jgi:hypothetical protein
MTNTIQQVVWQMEIDYIGHPYYVSGKAIRNALDQNGLPYEVHQHLSSSHGMFVPGAYGAFPTEHSQSGGRPSLGAALPGAEAYDDIFLHRDPSNTWLIDSQPRDALNTHAIRKHSGRLSIAPELIHDRPEDAATETRTTSWFVHAYLHSDTEDILPLDDSVLDGLQFGGLRNYGYGATRLKDTKLVDLDSIDYSRISESDEHLIEILTPFVLESEYPGTNDVQVPSWWMESREDLRLRTEKIISQGDEYELVTVDHGQVVEYSGDRPVETAKNALSRVGSHSRYGFGELRVKPL